jgi:MoaA/NifB/PqqE/SkfB family radical SAM enzyme/polysaccharide pyruvyl transferase WcaK-like protein
MMKDLIKDIAKKTIGESTGRKLFKDFKQLRKQYKDYKQLATLYYNNKVQTPASRGNLQKPHVVNLNANDICNSKCAMCNIWEQKQGFEVSPVQLKEILSDPLFSEVQHIGITGGEPTLREDLPELYKAVIEAIPGIHGLSIITNAIRENDVIERVEQVRELCESYGKNFSMMVSLDGFGETHDKVRGRPGNFNTAINVINHFKHKVPLAIGCTISKVNVWEVDELLYYMRNNEIYGRFRVAEFIKRLYNDNKANVIRNFDADEVYHLQLFFYKLIFTYEKNETYRRTYKSIINILNGGKRLIGCPYQSNGIVLNSRGEIAYCAPKSAIIGNGLAESGQMIYESNLDERTRIRANECDSCIHDYHAPITYEEKRLELDQRYWKKKLSINQLSAVSISDMMVPAKRLVEKGIPQVLIVGWYGTETVGDKAILGGIVDQLNALYQNNFQLVIASIYPFITDRTCQELNLKAHVIETYTADLIAYSKGSDVVIMGGGPLMDLEDLAIPLKAFQYAKKSGNKTIIYGCGLGPLTKSKYINAVKEILNLADEIKLRDNKSINMARSQFEVKKEVTLSGDPAKMYLSRYPKENKESTVLRCYLRDWTHEYAVHLTPVEFELKKIEFERALANYIKQKSVEIGATEIRLENMHNFVVGNDDRDFSRHFISHYFSDWTGAKITYDKYLASVDSIVKVMQNSAHNICMRFHSVVFAHTLNTSFTAVDYTIGGKINNYLSDNNCIERLVNVEELIAKYS